MFFIFRWFALETDRNGKKYVHFLTVCRDVETFIAQVCREIFLTLCISEYHLYISYFFKRTLRTLKVKSSRNNFDAFKLVQSTFKGIAAGNLFCNQRISKL